MRKHSSAVIGELLSEITPVERIQVNTKMTLAARLDDLIKARGWSKSEFAERVNKNPSEITKWLSGTQNFTTDTLAEIAFVLNMPVAELFAAPKVQVVNKVHYVVKRQVAPGIPYATPLESMLNEPDSVYLTGSRYMHTFPLTCSIPG